MRGRSKANEHTFVSSQPFERKHAKRSYSQLIIQGTPN
jgi:hypothetical protein